MRTLVGACLARKRTYLEWKIVRPRNMSNEPFQGGKQPCLCVLKHLLLVFCEGIPVHCSIADTSRRLQIADEGVNLTAGHGGEWMLAQDSLVMGESNELLHQQRQLGRLIAWPPSPREGLGGVLLTYNVACELQIVLPLAK